MNVGLHFKGLKALLVLVSVQDLAVVDFIGISVVVCVVFILSVGFIVVVVVYVVDLNVLLYL